MQKLLDIAPNIINPAHFRDHLEMHDMISLFLFLFDVKYVDREPSQLELLKIQIDLTRVICHIPEL